MCGDAISTNEATTKAVDIQLLIGWSFVCSAATKTGLVQHQ